MAGAMVDPAKAKVSEMAHRSKKSFIRLLSNPRATSAWSFSATTVSGGYARRCGKGMSSSDG